MKNVYRLVGYDKRTERMVDSHIVPDRYVDRARRVAHFSDDPGDVGDAPLTASEAKDIASIISVMIDPWTRDLLSRAVRRRYFGQKPRARLNQISFSHGKKSGGKRRF